MLDTHEHRTDTDDVVRGRAGPRHGPDRRGPPAARLLDLGAQRGQDPLTVQRVHVELYIRWMQEIRGFKP